MTVLNGLLNVVLSKRRSFPLHSLFSDYATLKMLLNGRGDGLLCEQLSQFLILLLNQDVAWLILSSNEYPSGSGPSGQHSSPSRSSSRSAGALVSLFGPISGFRLAFSRPIKGLR